MGNEFDLKALEWDDRPQNIELAKSFIHLLEERLPLKGIKNAFEYGCGTGILSVFLSEKLPQILMADTSQGMLEILRKKIKEKQIPHLRAIELDLTQQKPPATKFDLIYLTMTLHHISETQEILNTFFGMLNPGGYLAVGDLMQEDGSFHGEGFSGHNGFHLPDLLRQFERSGFQVIHQAVFFQMKKMTEAGGEREYPVFAIIAQK